MDHLRLATQREIDWGFDCILSLVKGFDALHHATICEETD